MGEEDLIRQLTAVIAAQWEDGCPVADYDDVRQREDAAIALRRWRSIHRRSKRRSPTLEERIEDLAKGLRDAFWSDPKLVGPLMEDYRHLARALAAVLAGDDDQDTSSSVSGDAQIREGRRIG